jgi:hypothetical protein
VPLAVKRSVLVRAAESVTDPPAVIVEAESVVWMDGFSLVTVTEYVTLCDAEGFPPVPCTMAV